MRSSCWPFGIDDVSSIPHLSTAFPFLVSFKLTGEKIQTILTHAPGNDAYIGGFKVVAENGWFAARPSGTENIYNIYGKSFRGTDHALRRRGIAENCKRCPCVGATRGRRRMIAQ